MDIRKPVRVEVNGSQVLYGLTGITTDGESIYGDINAPTLEVPKGKQLKHLYLIVMGAPEEHFQIPMPTDENPEPPQVELEEFPYELKV